MARPATPARERKRLVRLLLEDVTLTRGEKIKVQVRFKGGRCETLELPLPPTIEQVRKTDPAVVAEIDHLLDRHTDSEIAALLNEREMVSGAKLASRLRPFDACVAATDSGVVTSGCARPDC